MGKAIYEIIKFNFDVQLCDRETKVNDSDIFLFAVKPQDFDLCLNNLNINLSQKTIISIMAGVSLAKLEKKTGSKKVVRSMPNLPVQVGAGFTAWIASPKIEDKESIRKIFSGIGKEIEVYEENKLNAVTALSGSGPAYFFYICELLGEKAKELGFNESEARIIAESTFIGSAELLKVKERSSHDLRISVTSKGGTTEAAFKSFTENSFDKHFKVAIESAYNRSKELNKIHES